MKLSTLFMPCTTKIWKLRERQPEIQTDFKIHPKSEYDSELSEAKSDLETLKFSDQYQKRGNNLFSDEFKF